MVPRKGQSPRFLMVFRKQNFRRRKYAKQASSFCISEILSRKISSQCIRLHRINT